MLCVRMVGRCVPPRAERALCRGPIVSHLQSGCSCASCLARAAMTGPRHRALSSERFEFVKLYVPANPEIEIAPIRTGRRGAREILTLRLAWMRAEGNFNTSG